MVHEVTAKRVLARNCDRLSWSQRAPQDLRSTTSKHLEQALSAPSSLPMQNTQLESFATLSAGGQKDVSENTTAKQVSKVSSKSSHENEKSPEPTLGAFASLPSEVVLDIMDILLKLRARGEGCGCHDCDAPVPKNHASLLEFMLCSRAFYKMGLPILLSKVVFAYDPWEDAKGDAAEVRKQLRNFAQDSQQSNKFAVVRSLKVPSCSKNVRAIAVIKSACLIWSTSPSLEKTTPQNFSLLLLRSQIRQLP